LKIGYKKLWEESESQRSFRHGKTSHLSLAYSERQWLEDVLVYFLNRADARFRL
jgi:hypothetical protein